MVKLPYTYKGRPITAYGKRKHGLSRQQQRRGMTGGRLLFAFLLLCFFTALAAGGTFLFKHLERTSTAPFEQSVANPAEPLPLQTPAVPALPVPGDTVTPEVLPSALNEEASREAMKVYSAGMKAYRERNYEEARKAMRLLLEQLALPVKNPLYSNVCSILGKSSMQLYRNGSDPADWTEYEVTRGDNLSHLAKKFSTSVSAIQESNRMTGTNLRIGQKLRIPQSVWRILIDRADSRILLYNNGRLFKIYPVLIGKRGTLTKEGLYHIRAKRTNPPWQDGREVYPANSPDNPLGSRFLLLAPERDENHAEAGIHGRSGATEQAGMWYSMTEADIQELYTLTPEGTAAEITKQHGE